MPRPSCVEEIVSYRKDVTGIDHTLFISPKGHTRHGPRIKLAVDPPDSVDPRGPGRLGLSSDLLT
jgi:hypothetical protein